MIKVTPDVENGIVLRWVAECWVIDNELHARYRGYGSTKEKALEDLVEKLKDREMKYRLTEKIYEPRSFLDWALPVGAILLILYFLFLVGRVPY